MANTTNKVQMQVWQSLRDKLLELAQKFESNAELRKKYDRISFYANEVSKFLDPESPNAGKENMTEPGLVLALVQPEIIDQFLAAPSSEGAVALEHQLGVIVEAVFPPTLKKASYSAQEVGDKLKNEVIMGDYEKLIYSVFQLQFIDKEKQPLTKAALEFFDVGKGKDLASLAWEVRLVYAILLNFCFARWGSLKDKEKELLFRNYYLFAIELGISLRTILTNLIITDEWIVPYVYDSVYFCTELENNNETVLTGDGKKLGEIIKNFNKTFEGKIPGSKDVSDFVYGLDKNNLFLAEALDIYVSLKYARLVDWINDRPLVDEETHKEDLLKLYVYFIFGSLDRMVVYFSHDPKLKLKIFLNKLKNQVDLNDFDVVDKLSKFGQALKAKSLLAPADEVLVFTESDSQFHWNEDLLKI